MSTTRDVFSPTGSWETQSEDMDDDMDYEVSEVAFHHHHNPTMKLESGEEEEKEKTFADEGNGTRCSSPTTK